MPRIIGGVVYLSAREAAEKASVGHFTVIGWIRERKIPSIKVAIRNTIWSYVEARILDDFLRKRASLPRQPARKKTDTVKRRFIYEGKPFVSVHEAARQAGMTNAMIYVWIKGKRSLPFGCTLPAIRLPIARGEGVYYVCEESLKRIIQRRLLPIAVEPSADLHVIVEVHLVISHPENPSKVLLLRCTNTDVDRYNLISGLLKSGETLDECTVRIARERRIIIDASWLKQIHVGYQNINPGRFNFFYAIRPGKIPLGEVLRILRSHESENDLQWYPLDGLPKNIDPSVYEGLSHHRGSYPGRRGGARNRRNDR